MKQRIFLARLCGLWLAAGTVTLWAAPLPANYEPILRIEPGGPTCFVSSLAFSPDGQTLYAAGWDKVVHVWTRDGRSGQFAFDPAATYRVPVGPGLHGALNAVALSSDGALLATAGQGLVSVAADYRQAGFEIPEIGGLDAAGYQQQGTIYVFDTRRRAARALVGHAGPVMALAFAPSAAGKPPLLVSAAREWDGSKGARVDVVRLWNAATAECLDGTTLRESPPQAARPALAVWHTGAEPKQLRVAIAWGDQSDASLRTWDVQGKSLATVRDGQYVNTAIRDAVADKLLTGSVSRLKLWSVPAAANSPSVFRELNLPPRHVPRAAALFSSRPDGPLDRLAVVVRVVGANEEVDHLRFIDLAAFQWLDGDIRLWDGRGVMPTIASAPAGRHLAVTGGSGHELLVFDVDELSAGRIRSQSLRAPGMVPRFAEFVRREQQLGLLLSEKMPPGPAMRPRPPENGDLVFDPKAGTVTSPVGWAPDAPSADAWRLSQRMVAQNKESVVEIAIEGPGQGPSRILLKPREQLTAYAVLPPAAAGDVPLVAVASHRLGQPSLHLYNGRTGEAVRWLNGHVERIGSLAFSSDRHFLLSAAEDHLLCVWKLDDLDQIMGKRAALAGVALERQGDWLRIAAVDPDSPPQLAQGDLLAGVVEGGQLRPFATPLEFYLAVSHYRPGQTIVVSRAKPGGRREEVAVRLGQGVDERKPLFSWFLTRNLADGSWQWVGWSPLGPFDASRVAAQRLLGWHFNSGTPEQPVRFARADAYEKLRFPGLIAHFLEGKPGLPVRSLLLRPLIRLSLEQSPGERQMGDGSGILLRHGPSARLLVALSGPAAAEISSVTWHAGASTPLACKEESARIWSAPLSDVPWGRADQTLRVVLRTKESEPQTFVEEAKLRCQPPPPIITVTSPETERLVVDKPAFRFSARVTAAGPESLAAEVTLVHLAGEKEVLRQRWAADARVDLDRSLELQPGDNTVRLIAVNRDAPAESKNAEIAVRERTLVYRRPAEVAPPVLALRLVPPDESPQPRPGDAGAGIVVHEPWVRIQGQIGGAEPLIEAAWQRGAGVAAPLSGFSPGSDKGLAVDEKIALAPGAETIRCTARTAHSRPTTTIWNVLYRPPLPYVVWSGPAQDATLRAGHDEPQIVLAGRLQMPKDKTDRPLDIVLLANGEPLSVRPVLDARQETFSAAVTLRPGTNQFQARLSDRWGGVAFSDVRRVHYLRPPEIAGIDRPAEPREPFADVVFRARSPAELPLSELQVAGRPVPLAAAAVERHDGSADVWVVATRHVPLSVGKNRIAVSARNADGWSNSQTIDVLLVPPPPPKAEIEFRHPAVDVVSDNPRVPVQLVVRSRSRLREVSLHVARRSWNLEVGKQIARPDGFELSVETGVEVPEGAHQLQATAVNDGGESSAQVQFSYVPRPIRIVIDRVVGEKSGEVMRPEPADSRPATFSRLASDGMAWLFGRIVWPDAAAQQRQPAGRLYVTVNGFLQPAVLESKSDVEQGWKARIRLSRPQNSVEVKVPQVAVDARDQVPFQIGCRNPDTRQHLHLLIIGVDQANPQALCQRALAAVQGRAHGNQLVSPAFFQGTIYSPLVGHVTKPAIIDQLVNIQIAIRGATSLDAGNDVVLLYYRGAEQVDAKSKQCYLLSSESQYDPDLKSSALSEAELAEIFDPLPGAQVFLLDVARLPPLAEAGVRPVVPAWSDDARIAALRWAWLQAVPPADDAGLLSAIGKSLPKAGQLQEIGQAIQEEMRAAKARYGDNLAYDQYIPSSLQNLVLRQP